MSDPTVPPRAPAPATRAADPVGGQTRAPDTTGAVYSPIVLPDALQGRFTAVRMLTALGGQAASLGVYRRIDGADDDLVVIKLYRSNLKPGQADPRSAFAKLDPAHVVRFEEYGQADGYLWEVLEYAPLGTLAEYVHRQGGRLDEEALIVVLRELGAAIDHIHAQQPQIIHRDLKPSNVLLRSENPLDLVLTDFGTAAQIELSREARTRGNGTTAAYAPPEDGEVATPFDWWGLGMSLLELALGQHPFFINGAWLSDSAISAALTRPIPTGDITSPRLLLLFSGLLTINPEHRWGSAQLLQWIDGGTPAVAAVPQQSAPSRSRIAPFPFGSTGYADPVSLAAAMSADWSRAGDVIASRDFDELISWVERNFADHSLEYVRTERKRTTLSIDRVVAEIIVRLDPECNPVFLGHRVDLEALVSVPARAADDNSIFTMVDKLWSSRALRAFASLDGHEDLAIVDARWQDHCAAASEWFTAVKVAGSMTPELRAMILQIAATEVRDEAAAHVE